MRRTGSGGARGAPFTGAGISEQVRRVSLWALPQGRYRISRRGARTDARFDTGATIRRRGASRRRAAMWLRSTWSGRQRTVTRCSWRPLQARFAVQVLPVLDLISRRTYANRADRQRALRANRLSRACCDYRAGVHLARQVEARDTDFGGTAVGPRAIWRRSCSISVPAPGSRSLPIQVPRRQPPTR